MTRPAPPPAIPSPQTKPDVLDRDFLAHRAKVLDLAAFLDRLDRAPAAGSSEAESSDHLGDDPRPAALLAALQLLSDGQPERARRVLDLWSDPTTDPLDAAPPTPVLGVPAATND